MQPAPHNVQRAAGCTVASGIRRSSLALQVGFGLLGSAEAEQRQKRQAVLAKRESAIKQLTEVIHHRRMRCCASRLLFVCRTAEVGPLARLFVCVRHCAQNDRAVLALLEQEYSCRGCWERIFPGRYCEYSRLPCESASAAAVHAVLIG